MVSGVVPVVSGGRAFLVR
ncbi:hypothetical protein A2U01_0027932, partial [Trifolium medium]|nr:hypothetical protein [Trifolium medium]